MEGGDRAPTSAQTLERAKAATESFKAQEAQIRVRKLKGELVDRKEVEAHVTRMAREERAAFEEFAIGCSDVISKEFGGDVDAIRKTIEREVRKHLELRSGVRVQVGA
ncbi:hypothetical protein [Oceaniovalibus sp. ACAM 378]|uniref:hypothetical protein n=1 Tax=Oceaniovalibus sp. ACAM 378 TaxID=2599923 RepID=UPI0011DB2EEE|nr:hypothetical protein [Oceaniovalibus sp. ACAM 378]TYB83961.1 hypothetical protein FQ320_23355 [Oceaniovalibus sp. ACAM 378]